MSKMDVHFSSGKDDWQTPVSFFAPLQAEFDICIDLAASHANRMPGCFWYGPSHPKRTRRDTLALAPSETTPELWAWCNPPYSRTLQPQFVKFCSERGRVVMLLPSRTDTVTFHRYIWNTKRNRACADTEVRFVKGRITFVGAKDSAPFPSMVVIFR